MPVIKTTLKDENSVHSSTLTASYTFGAHGFAGEHQECYTDGVSEDGRSRITLSTLYSQWSLHGQATCHTIHYIYNF